MGCGLATLEGSVNFLPPTRRCESAPRDPWPAAAMSGQAFRYQALSNRGDSAMGYEHAAQRVTDPCLVRPGRHSAKHRRTTDN